MFRTLFLGSCPILLYVPHKLLSGGTGQTRLWCNSHDHHQRTGLPSDAVPPVQELISLAYFATTIRILSLCSKGLSVSE